MVIQAHQKKQQQNMCLVLYSIEKKIPFWPLSTFKKQDQKGILRRTYAYKHFYTKHSLGSVWWTCSAMCMRANTLSTLYVCVSFGFGFGFVFGFRLYVWMCGYTQNVLHTITVNEHWRKRRTQPYIFVAFWVLERF